MESGISDIPVIVNIPRARSFVSKCHFRTKVLVEVVDSKGGAEKT